MNKLRANYLRLLRGERQNRKSGNWERVRYYRARRVKAKRDYQAAKVKRPPVRKVSGVVWGSPFGGLGVISRATIHYTAGPRDKSVEDAIRLDRQYAKHHASSFGSQGIGYHLNIAKDGTILCLRPLSSKGAHTGGNNSGNVGVMFHGTTGDQPSAEQAKAFRWWLAHGHSKAMPAGFRTPRPPRQLDVRGHREWPGPTNQTACPGSFISLRP